MIKPETALVGEPKPKHVALAVKTSLRAGSKVLPKLIGDDSGSP